MEGRRFWQGKRVLVTGHTGFKGSWLTLWLHQLGARVTGIALAPDTSPSLYAAADIAESCDSHIVDIRDGARVRQVARDSRPEIVFHLAAQALVRRSYREPVDNWSTNVMGTVNVLDALRGLESARCAVMITTDKVYENRETMWPYRESDDLGGHDPYSASKAACEIAIASYRASFLSAQGVAVASARAGNVIGGGDWAEERLIPDAVRAWQKNASLQIRRPDAVRPWQHVLEPLSGYLTLAQRLWSHPELAEAFNFGPEPSNAATVREVVECAQKHYGGAVAWQNEAHGPHEAGLLALDPTKARVLLQVRPRWSLSRTLERTMLWYRRHHDGEPAEKLCCEDIAAYETEDVATA